MAETFIREPNENGDNNAWAPYLLQQTRNTLGALSAYLYNDSGALKLAPGVIGIDDGTNKGTIINSAAKTISLALVSVSSWAKIEVSVSGTSVTISASDATAGTDPAALPTEFKNAYNATKGGFYIAATKRCIGLAWRNASGTLEGVVNCLPLIDGWIGYSQSDDGDDIPYIFEKHIETTKQQEGDREFNERTILNGGVFNSYEFDSSGVELVSNIASGLGVNTLKYFYVKKPILCWLKAVMTGTGGSVFFQASQNSLWKLFLSLSNTDTVVTSVITSAGAVTDYRYSLSLTPGYYRISSTANNGNVNGILYCCGVYGKDLIEANDIVEII